VILSTVLQYINPMLSY